MRSKTKREFGDFQMRSAEHSSARNKEIITEEADVGRKTEEDRTQGGHRPHEDGPRLFTRTDRGPWWYADLRPWNGKRRVLRDPEAPNWPEGGVKTQDKAQARRWS